MEPRVATLVPSATDLVAALGYGAHLVGVSHECDHPAAASRPVVTRSTIPAAGTADGADPALVDDAVSAALAAGGSLYVADRPLLAELAPDLVVGQEVCDVCAVSGPVARAALPEGAELLTLTATSTSTLLEDVRRLAAALDDVAAGEAAVTAITAGLEAVRAAVADRPRPRVLTLEWLDPAFLGGHWVPELVEIAGGRHELSGAGEPSRRATWDEVAEADPDVLVLLPCGYDLTTTAAHAHPMLARPELRDLRCVAAGQVWVTDANRLFSRCTTNVVDAAWTLAGILHPESGATVATSDAVRVTG
ncbi:MAG: ABC transporter substrate-binding protein [Nitriliruptoraceae bacterium]